MIPPLSPELQAQIEQEAKDYAQKRCDDLEGKKHLHRKTLLMYAHQEGAKAYASLWQEAEQRVADLNLALAAMLNGYQNLSIHQRDWFIVPKDLIDEYTKMVIEYNPKTTNDE